MPVFFISAHFFHPFCSGSLPYSPHSGEAGDGICPSAPEITDITGIFPNRAGECPSPSPAARHPCRINGKFPHAGLLIKHGQPLSERGLPAGLSIKFRFPLQELLSVFSRINKFVSILQFYKHNSQQRPFLYAPSKYA